MCEKSTFLNRNNNNNDHFYIFIYFIFFEVSENVGKISLVQNTAPHKNINLVLIGCYCVTFVSIFASNVNRHISERFCTSWGSAIEMNGNANMLTDSFLDTIGYSTVLSTQFIGILNGDSSWITT